MASWGDPFTSQLAMTFLCSSSTPVTRSLTTREQLAKLGPPVRPFPAIRWEATACSVGGASTRNLHVLRRAQTTLVPLAALSYHSPGIVAIGSA
jgi:hypothetical protein